MKLFRIFSKLEFQRVFFIRIYKYNYVYIGCINSEKNPSECLEQKTLISCFGFCPWLQVILQATQCYTYINLSNKMLQMFFYKYFFQFTRMGQTDFKLLKKDSYNPYTQITFCAYSHICLSVPLQNLQATIWVAEIISSYYFFLFLNCCL